MFTKLGLAALIAAAVTLSAPVLATQNNSDAAVTSVVDSVTAQGWCSGPRRHTDFHRQKLILNTSSDHISFQLPRYRQ